MFELVTVEEMTEILNSQPRPEVLPATPGDENQNQLDEQIRQLKEVHKNRRDSAAKQGQQNGDVNGDQIPEENGDQIAEEKAGENGHQD